MILTRHKNSQNYTNTCPTIQPFVKDFLLLAVTQSFHGIDILSRNFLLNLSGFRTEGITESPDMSFGTVVGESNDRTFCRVLVEYRPPYSNITSTIYHQKTCRSVASPASPSHTERNHGLHLNEMDRSEVLHLSQLTWPLFKGFD